MTPDFFTHPKAICETDNVGNGSKVWAFAHVLSGAVIGENCNICDGVFIENEVVIGDSVTIKCGVQIWDGISIQDDVFIGPNVTFSNDKFPRSKEYPEEYLKMTVEQGASIGANATILPGINIGRKAMVGAGSVVTKSVPPYAVVLGNPAKIVNYITHEESGDEAGVTNGETVYTGQNLGVGKCQVLSLPTYKDMRGGLMVVERANCPFDVARSFFVYDVPSSKVRGEHAHLECEQFLVAIKGSLSVVIDDGSHRKEVLLDTPEKGLYLSSKVWGIQYKFTSDAVLCVFASHPYDESDYIRDYSKFVELIES